MTISLRQQRTISRPAIVEGFGYWSGRDVRIEFRPAPADTGIVFVRSDLDPPRRIPASVCHRTEIPRRTSLYHADTSVEMVEHIMAALAGLRIDNGEVWVDSPEMPGCDGSSLPFVLELESAGIVEQPALRSYLAVSKRICVGDRRSWVEARPTETSGLTIQCFIDYGPTGPIGRQAFRLHVTPDSFREELSAARTYLLQEEAQWLRSQGLGARVTCRDLLVFDSDGPIDNVLRFDDECVRHKTLDAVGDLALAGCDLIGHVTAYCSGHRLNAELVKALLAECQVTRDLRMTG